MSQLLSTKNSAFYGSCNNSCKNIDQWSDVAAEQTKTKHPRPKRSITVNVNKPVMTLSWERITLTMTSKNGITTTLLNGVSGVLIAGEIVAILGPSGAGKTTLLDTIFGTQPRNTVIQGMVRCWSIDAEIVSEVRSKGEFSVSNTTSSLIAYISQLDMFYEMLTVQEHLEFQVRFRRPEVRNAIEQRSLVSKALIDLSIENSADTLISKLSGGERRRVSVATELLSEPTFLLCDEITTGLDMYQALQLVQCLKSLRSTGVLCTIHQPPTQVYSLFSRSMYMVGGRLVAEGTQGQILQQFEDIGYPCPSTSNPADFVIRILSASCVDEIPYRKFLKSVEQMYKQSKSKYVTDFLIEVHTKTMNKGMVEKRVQLTLVDEWALILKRTIKYTARDKVYKQVRVFQVIFISTVLGLLYLNTEYDNIQNIMGSLFFFLINISFSAIFATLQTFPNELPVFRREYKNKVVRIGPYFLAKTLAELPFYMMYPTIYIIIAYFLVGYTASAAKFFMYWFIMLLVYHTSLSLGYLISASTPDAQMANTLGLPIGVVLFLFSGYFINVPTIPKAMRWLVYLSYMYFGYQGVLYNELHGVTFATKNSSKWSSGDQVLSTYGFAGRNVLLTDSLALFTMMVLYRFAAYFALIHTTKKRR